MHAFRAKLFSSSSIGSLILKNLAVSVLYAIAVQLSTEFASLPGRVAAVWLPSGLTLALVLVHGWKPLAGIFIGSFLGLFQDLAAMQPQITLGEVVLLNLLCAIANCLQPVLGSLLIKRLTTARFLFNQVSSVIVFLIAGLVAPMSSAVIGVTALYWLNLISWSDYGLSWLTWWLASAVAHIVFTPPLLLWRDPAQRRLPRRALEVGLFYGLIALLCWCVFGAGYPLEYMLLPALVWAGLRFSKFNASCMVGLVSAIAIVATAHGVGGFVRASENESLLILQSFTAVCSLTLLVLSAVHDERDAAQVALGKMLATLEQEVARRTEQLRQSEATTRQILNGIPDVIIWMDRYGTILEQIRGVHCVSGVIQDQPMIGRKVYDIFPDEFTQILMEKVFEAFETEKTAIFEQTLLLDNETRYEEVRVVVAEDNRALILIRDISDRKQAENQLKAQQAFLQQVIDAMPSPVFVKDLEGRFLVANRAAVKIHDSTLEQMLGKRESDFNQNCHDNQVEQFFAQNQLAIDLQQSFCFADQAITSKSGETRWYQTIISPFLDIQGRVQGVIGNCLDITERRQIELALRDANEELQRRATIDSLTHIANRRRFDEYLSQEWRRLLREQQPLSLILCDVDYFKRYNDHYGHQAGDDCLMQVAQVLNRTVKRSADLVTRYGGEEFAVILPNTDRLGATQMAIAICEAVREAQIPHAASEIEPFVTVSLGVASLVPDRVHESTVLITFADHALYRAKTQGRNTYCIYAH